MSGDQEPRREERVRLFVALELPEEVRRSLAEWSAVVTGRVDGLRLVPPESLHVTLCFLGSQSADAVEAIAAACRRIAVGGGRIAVGGPIELTVGEALWLPPRRPRVLAVALHETAPRLATLQSGLEARLHEGGWYEPERRPYRPHVTTARVRRGVRVPSNPVTAPPPLSFTAPRVTLFRSRLSPAGARYEAVASVEVG